MHYNEVEIEDVTTEEYPDLYMNNNTEVGIPFFTKEVFKEVEEKLQKQRVVKDKDSVPLETKPHRSPILFDYNVKKLNKWLETVWRAQEQYYIQTKAKFSDKQKTNYINLKTAKGDIVSWMYEPYYKICIVKWENDIQYFERFNDILTMSRWDVSTSPYRPFIKRKNVELLRWFHSHLVYEI